MPCHLILRRAPHHVPKLSPSTLSCRPVRAIAPQQHPANRIARALATVRPDPRVLPDVWFTGSVPRRNTQPPLPPSAEPHKPDERTVKLGKSKSSSPCSPPLGVYVVLTACEQLSESSKSAFQPSCSHPSRRTSSPLTSVSTSSPPPTHTSLPSPAESHTLPRSGPPRSHGDASPSSATSASRSCLSAW